MLASLATADDLHLWAYRRETEGRLPELIRRLITATIPMGQVTRFEMRSGTGIRARGYDGILELDEAHAPVPVGLSVWESGCGGDPKKKFEDDYGKRTDNPLEVTPSGATFIFVTPHRWTAKEAVAEEKRVSGPWKNVVILDADDLLIWLDRAPVVHAWLSALVGKPAVDIEDLSTFSQNWRNDTNPPFSAALVLAGRHQIASRVAQHLREEPGALVLRGDSEEEALAVAAACIEELPDGEAGGVLERSLIVYSLNAWRVVALSESPMLLLPKFDSVPISQAVGSGHHALVPTGRETAIESSAVVDILPLASQEAERALIALGLMEERARELAKIGHRSMRTLRRRLSYNPEIQQPKWARGTDARMVLPALLAGGWDERREQDKTAVAELAGRSYQAVAADLVRLVNESDPPVQQIGSRWSLVSKEDAWVLLARFLIRQDMERFHQVVEDVLDATDPAIQLPPEQRWTAGTRGLMRPHSSSMRQGLADTLAVMATLSENETVGVGGTTTGQEHATIAVRGLLEKANGDHSGDMWTSLSDVLPLIAEAAPLEFLAGADRGTTGSDPILRKLFTDEVGDPFARSAHPYLQWALERLAWSPDYLGRAALVLAHLAALDPGGRLGDRPYDSLARIFSSLRPHTTVTASDKFEVIDLLRQQETQAAWKLMLSMIPHFPVTIFPTSSPERREWRPEGWDAQTTSLGLQNVIDELVSRLLTDMDTESERICDTIDMLGRLPSANRAAVLQRLEMVRPSDLDEESREIISKKLREEFSRHRQFSTAQWAMPAGDVDRLERLYEALRPSSLVKQNAWLFTSWPELPGEDRRDYAAYRERIHARQTAAATQVYDANGLHGVEDLMVTAEQPFIVGYAVGKGGIADDDQSRLLELISAEDATYRHGAIGYVVGRFERSGWPWVDSVLQSASEQMSPEQVGRFFLGLPRIAESWNRLEEFNAAASNTYWTELVPRVDDLADVVRAIDELGRHGRSWASLDLLALHLDQLAPEPRLVMDVLDRAITSDVSDDVNSSLHYAVTRLLDYLEASDSADESRLARIEWAFVSALRLDGRQFKVLDRAIAADPTFFVDLVTLAFRASDEEPSDDIDKQAEQRAMTAYTVLDIATLVPGVRDDETVGKEGLDLWVAEARRSLEERKRLTVGEQRIGHLLQKAPADSDGTWPPRAVCALLEELRSDEIERGLELAIYNSRGITTRGAGEGGEQERHLASDYRDRAALLRNQGPRMAALFNRLAAAYESDARSYDRDAERREERS